jgi:hypothetical protein
MFGKIEFKNPIVVVAPFKNEQNFTNFAQKKILIELCYLKYLIT